MATAEGTRRLLARAVERGVLHKANVRVLPRSDLACSALGFGAYRIGGGGPDLEVQHLIALRAALRAGVNLIDTSSHYAAKGEGLPKAGHGASERLIGRALAQAVEVGDVTRDEVVVCTKLGHVARGTPRSDIPAESVPVSPQPGAEDDFHSIDPSFVEAEVHASRERLGTPPDFVLLHNPEYFLSEQLRRRTKIADAWDEMYTRLYNAFVTMESLCDEGVIGTGYGVSANFLSCMYSTTGRSNLYEALAVDRVVDAAMAAAKSRGMTEHRLRLVQMPLNSLEGGAVLGRAEVVPEAAEGDIALAARLGLGVVGNRPLNAIPPPGLSSGDWGRSGASHVRLREARPMGTVEALMKRVLVETLQEDEGLGELPLQQVALRLGLSAPGISACLCGMRTERYVEDASAVLAAAPLHEDTVKKALLRIRSALEELGATRRGLW